MIEVDVRGFSCPIPVVRTKKAMDDNPEDELSVLVDSAVSKENVSRLAQSRGYSVSTNEVEDGFHLSLRRPGK
jgi:tRNA 2-thiouridine synthesizing protein A